MTRKLQIPFLVSEEEKDAVDKAAKERGWSRQRWIREAVASFLGVPFNRTDLRSVAPLHKKEYEQWVEDKKPIVANALAIFDQMYPEDEAAELKAEYMASYEQQRRDRAVGVDIFS